MKELKLDGVLSRDDGTDFSTDAFFDMLDAAGLIFGGGATPLDDKGEPNDGDDT